VSWPFHRRHESEPAAVSPPPLDEPDSPEALRHSLAQLIRFINQNSARLPGVTVVHARRVTDTLQAIVDTSEVRPLEIHALISLKGIMNDYLPTTLRNFLAVDERFLRSQQLSGRSPTQSLMEQLDILHTSAERVLLAVRSQDADALVTQGNFLRTKFTGSDLDL
jgi:hypothetical protein